MSTALQSGSCSPVGMSAFSSVPLQDSRAPSAEEQLADLKFAAAFLRSLSHDASQPRYEAVPEFAGR